MTNELLHGDLCPLCRCLLRPRTRVVVRSNVPSPTRTDYLPHCTTCAHEQRWNDLMNDRYGL
ncbi:hypothetical protein [Streptomyces halstedii]|uniref:hypothetical protein n=1 Tax=Streptomyces halstedii TaxID=1944 RepID=UPI00380627C9